MQQDLFCSVSPNGGSPNGVSPNGVSPNGVSPNGVSPSPNGVSLNGGSPIGGSPIGVSPNGGGPKRSHSCIGAFSIQFEDTFENAQWRKVKQPLYIMTSHQPYGLTQWNLFEFSGASENSREHLRFYWSVCDFTGASESQRGF